MGIHPLEAAHLQKKLQSLFVISHKEKRTGYAVKLGAVGVVKGLPPGEVLENALNIVERNPVKGYRPGACYSLIAVASRKKSSSGGMTLPQRKKRSRYGLGRCVSLSGIGGTRTVKQKISVGLYSSCREQGEFHFFPRSRMLLFGNFQSHQAVDHAFLLHDPRGSILFRLYPGSQAIPNQRRKRSTSKENLQFRIQSVGKGGTQKSRQE